MKTKYLIFVHFVLLALSLSYTSASFQDYEGIVDFLFRGGLFNSHLKSMGFISAIEISGLFNFLYRVNSNFSWWYYINILIINAFHLLVVFQILASDENKNNSKLFFSVFLINFLGVLVVSALFSNTSSSLVGLGLGLQVFLFSKSKRVLFVSILGIIYFSLLRYEMAIIIAAAILPAIFIFYKYFKIKRIQIIGLLIVVSFVFFRVNIEFKKNQNIAKLHNLVYLLTISSDNLNPSNKSVFDYALNNNILNDSIILNSQKLSSPRNTSFNYIYNKLNSEYIHINLNNFARLLYQSKTYVILIYIQLALLIYPLFNKKYDLVLVNLFINLSLFAVLFLLFLLIKLEGRVLLPCLLVFSSFQLLLLQLNTKFVHKLFSYLILSSILIVIGVNLIELKKENLTNSLLATTYSKSISTLNTKFSDKTLVVDIWSINLFGQGKLVGAKSIKNAIIGYDLSDMTLLKQYNSLLNKECHCNSRNLVEVLSFLKNNRGNYLFITSPDRIEIINTYLKKAHNIDLMFERVDAENFPLEVGGYLNYLYYLK